MKKTIVHFISLFLCIPLSYPAQSKSISEYPPQETIVHLAAAGDVLIHDRIYNDARVDTNQFNFSPMFAKVRSYIEKTDLALVNQESVIGGVEIGLSSYPAFNSPFDIAQALKNIGFDVVTLANNHALDRGEAALQNALSYWNELGMAHTGAFASKKDRNTICLVKKNDITFSILSYTYGTNGIPIPKGKDYLVNLIEKTKIKQDIQKAKQLCDVVIVAMHFGNEYETMPNEQQTKLSQFLADQGADIVIGHHPHVLQPPAFLTGKNGNQTFVMYSLGNFFAGQRKEETWIGGITAIKVKKITTGNITSIKLEEPSFLPTFTYSNNDQNFMVLPLHTVTKEQYANIDTKYKQTITHMKRFIPDLKIIKEEIK
ncbi:CapA family protein [Bacillus sp. 165]|uniref:CapA family protein n=1 Tax=Bacillus sp. 165 TaxID=1529117 RepID=UPI001ADAE011|nr:CapA family protein [Bacillus sp. 165]MBO9129769.1 CapA family protein [Bacillus sp. 165]